MDEAERQSGQAVDGGQQLSAEELRRNIEATRIELGDTVEALAQKTDVKAQAKQRIASAKDTAQQKADELVGKAKQAAPESANAGVQQVAATAQKKPLPFAVGGAFAAGILIGWLIARR